MITKLFIKNFALIEDITINFKSGLTSISGETGAGKSILLGALELILGKRADLNSVRDNSFKCVIEADFFLEDKLFIDLFKDHNLDFDSHTIIRRELLPSNKSRAFINDTPVSLSQLQSISSSLVDIHSQHESVSLFSEKYQLDILDILAGNKILLKNYLEKLNDYNEISETITELIYKKDSASKELDYNTFLYNELVDADLHQVNQEEIEKKYKRLNNVEEIQETLLNINNMFNEDDFGTLNSLKIALNSLLKLQRLSTEFNGIYERLNSVIIELEDIADETVGISESFESDPSLLNEIHNKLQIIYKLQQKHSVTNTNELLAIQKSLQEKVSITNNLDIEIDKLSIIQKNLKNILVEFSEKIHKGRLNVIPTLKDKLCYFLTELGMPNASFEFNLSNSKVFKQNGTDILELLFTANKGHNFGPLKKVVSGGELSRIMLAVKAVIAQYKQLPTSIFDEIDIGISGEIAYKMAAILKEMSLTMQMINITHLPQIAAVGNQHIKIYKEDINNITKTSISILNENERISEIAEMIGGKNKSISAINQAKELLN
ncbi:MAG: DNA repair protein RecN [Flavobacteriales bacterium]|nr:MAG: DNA repair protein RecN [Flavobacteriales bacterium]